jgi:hypothetical protein
MTCGAGTPFESMEKASLLGRLILPGQERCILSAAFQPGSAGLCIPAYIGQVAIKCCTACVVSYARA